MSQDVVQRLRDSVRACRALDRSSLLTEAADEIEKLRSLVKFKEQGSPEPDQIAENLHRLTERLK